MGLERKDVASVLVIATRRPVDRRTTMLDTYALHTSSLPLRAFLMAQDSAELTPVSTPRFLAWAHGPPACSAFSWPARAAFPPAAAALGSAGVMLPSM